MADQSQRKENVFARSKQWFRRKTDRLKDRLHIGSSSAPTTRPQSGLGFAASTSNILLGPNQQDNLAPPALTRLGQTQSLQDLATDANVFDDPNALAAPASSVTSGDIMSAASQTPSTGIQGQALNNDSTLQRSRAAATGTPIAEQDQPSPNEAPEATTKKPTSTPSAAKNILNRSLDFTQTLLKRLPDVVDENPVKVVLGLVKLVLEIKAEVQDNMDKTDEHISSTVAQLMIVTDVQIANWRADGPEVARLEEFKKTLQAEFENLAKLKGEHMLEKIASHEDEKSQIAAIFERVNGARIQFELYSNIRVLKAVLRIEQAVTRALQHELQPSHMADHQSRLRAKVRETLRRDACTPGTRTRILKNIVDWAADTSLESEDIYWLFGPAGSGKTTIAYTIARFFETASKADGGIVLGGNFLCSRQFEETRSETHIIRTLAYQLARKCEGFADALNELKNFDAIHQGVGAQMRDFLVTPWQKYISMRLQKGLPNMDRFLLLVDAVDELEKEGGQEFLHDLIEAVNASDLPGIKFFVTSRSNPDIVSLVESFERKRLVRLQDVDQEEVQRDIGVYLAAHLPTFEASLLKRVEDFAGNLFICAATVVRALTLTALRIEDQKKMLQKFVSTELKDATSFLDSLYTDILSEAFSAFKDQELFTEKLGILHAFLCTTERTSTSVVAELLVPDEGPSPPVPNAADDVLLRLHAVLYLDDCKNVLSYHKSFTDFLFDKNRSKRFTCDLPSYHHLLVESCFHTMNTGLKFNIANLPSSFLLDMETPGLQTKVEQNISPGLSYACRTWNQHLSATTPCNPSNPLLPTLSNFLKLQVLFWIETMNLLKCHGQCNIDLQQAAKWVGTNNHTLQQQLTETASFALYFSGSPASTSTPHLYISALATWPPNRSLAHTWRTHFPKIPDFKTFSPTHSMELVQINTRGSGLALAVSPDETKIFCGSQSGLVLIYDASTGEELKVLNGHTKQVNSVAISDDGKHIISGSNDETIRIWDASAGTELKVLKGHTNWVQSVAVSSGGTHIISGSDDNLVKIWDMATGNHLKTLEGHTNWAMSVAISADGSHIVSGSWDRSVHIWDGLTGEALAVLRGHTDPVRSVAISRDGAFCVSGSDDKSVRMWNVSTRWELKVLEGHTGPVYSVAITPDGASIVSGSEDKSVCIWDVSTGQQLKMLEGHSTTVCAVAIFSGGTRIASSSADGLVKIWDGSVEKEMEAVGHQSNKVHQATNSGLAGADYNTPPGLGVEGHKEPVTAVASSPDGKQIISGSDDNSIQVWDTSTGRQLKVLKGHGGTVCSVVILADGTHIVSGLKDRSVRVWDASTGIELRVLRGHTDWVRSVAISGDGACIVSGSDDRTVRIWDTSTGGELRVLWGHSNLVLSVAISSDGMHIISGSADKSVRIWDASTGEQLKVLEGHTDWVRSVAISGDGKAIVSGSDDNTVRLWDTLTGEELKVLEGHTRFVLAVAISADGMCIVSGSEDHSVRIWEASTGKVLGVLEGHKGAVNAVTISAVGKYVVSGSHDGTVRLWAIDPSHVHAPSSNTSGINMHVAQNLGWVTSPDKANHLIYIPTSLGFRSLPLVHIFPAPVEEVQPPSLELDYSALGTEWQNCYLPQLLPSPSSSAI